MTAKTGIRRIDDLSNGGRLVWLHGEPDLDDVMLELARTHDESWTETVTALRDGAAWPNDRSREALANAGERYMEIWAREYDAAHKQIVIEDHPTDLGEHVDQEIEVGWFRRMPWCHCGEGHDWHWEPSAPGRGASLAVLVEGGW